MIYPKQKRSMESSVNTFFQNHKSGNLEYFSEEINGLIEKLLQKIISPLIESGEMCGLIHRIEKLSVLEIKKTNNLSDLDSSVIDAVECLLHLANPTHLRFAKHLDQEVELLEYSPDNRNAYLYEIIAKAHQSLTTILNNITDLKWSNKATIDIFIQFPKTLENIIDWIADEKNYYIIFSSRFQLVKLIKKINKGLKTVLDFCKKNLEADMDVRSKIAKAQIHSVAVSGFDVDFATNIINQNLVEIIPSLEEKMIKYQTFANTKLDFAELSSIYDNVTAWYHGLTNLKKLETIVSQLKK